MVFFCRIEIKEKFYRYIVIFITIQMRCIQLFGFSKFLSQRQTVGEKRRIVIWVFFSTDDLVRKWVHMQWGFSVFRDYHAFSSWREAVVINLVDGKMFGTWLNRAFFFLHLCTLVLWNGIYIFFFSAPYTSFSSRRGRYIRLSVKNRLSASHERYPNETISLYIGTVSSYNTTNEYKEVIPFFPHPVASTNLGGRRLIYGRVRVYERFRHSPTLVLQLFQIIIILKMYQRNDSSLLSSDNKNGSN